MNAPRPMPPYLPLHPEADRARIQEAYEQAERDWQRAEDWHMIISAIPVLCAFIGMAVGALMLPGIALDAIIILTRIK